MRVCAIAAVVPVAVVFVRKRLDNDASNIQKTFTRSLAFSCFVVSSSMSCMGNRPSRTRTIRYCRDYQFVSPYIIVTRSRFREGTRYLQTPFLPQPAHSRAMGRPDFQFVHYYIVNSIRLLFTNDSLGYADKRPGYISGRRCSTTILSVPVGSINSSSRFTSILLS